jgi:AraC-like DNA-binding protein
MAYGPLTPEQMSNKGEPNPKRRTMHCSGTAAGAAVALISYSHLLLEGGHRMAQDMVPGGWVGSVVTGPGLLQFSGAVGATGAHAHAAVQMLVVSSGMVALRDAFGEERVVGSAIVPTGVRHEMFASPDACAAITYLDPVSRMGRLAAERVTATGQDPRSVDAWLVDVDSAAVTAAGPGRDPVHPAVADTLLLAAAAAEPMSLREVAARVALSASRLGHLFTEQVGVPYSVWRRWLRLQRALAAVQAGASLTAAAHAAGFADSAHLTRSCRAMFGITPSTGVRASSERVAGPREVSGFVQASS